MKLVLKTLTRGGCYTFLIVLALLLISHAMGIDEYGNYSIVVDLELYLASTLCGFIVAFAGLIFETKLDPIIKRAIHFVVLLGGFIIVFATSESGSGLAGRKVLIATVVFLVAYIAIFALLLAIKKIYALILRKMGYEEKQAPEKAPQPYKSIYKKK